MCTGMFGSPPPTVNSRGDTLSNADFSTATGIDNPFFHGKQLNLTPAQRGQMIFNWLTGGGLPKKKDPGEIFKEAGDTAGARAKGAAGSGIGGLFGAGLMIGDLVPKTNDLTPGGANSKSPLQSGVPYTVPAMVKMPTPGGK